MTAYYCEYAWLGGERVSANVLITVDGDTITKVEQGLARPIEAERYGRPVRAEELRCLRDTAALIDEENIVHRQ